MNRKILSLDIGSGTQDVLYYIEGVEVENCFKFVLPSPARVVAELIKKQTNKGCDIYLTGKNMGGGFGRAVNAHIKAGYKVFAHPRAALALGDDLNRLEKNGIVLSTCLPSGCVPVHLEDFNSGWWNCFLSAAGLEQPDLVVASVQDHGFHPGKSNRMGRFNLWKRFLLDNKGKPEELLFETVPEEFTRLSELQKSIGGGQVCDTGAAAVLGAFFVDEIVERSFREGICLINVGNSHTVSFLLFEGRVHGVYEHHTGNMTPEKLWSDSQLFRKGELSFESVFDDYGHGCATLDLSEKACGFIPTYVMGPRRAMLKGYPVEFPSPGGDMMLAGCFGLIKGLELKGTV
ncbi:Uncharacterized protein, DUF1786 family [Maridesulfovibrio ferrireducens]|uniref:Uncharacterized protein, DUF1786 family n=1 Tax=Maridesulfovibrio ferrireducens TaxID=246191 RepID=A0A1G9LQI9_9BACT|nr:DUF1786 domain-containing protein [Maridesulfovibrio ferrireducens]SDL64269.1 Uncharacterized protein, DUF1786 family [Maridesulfovibrio ferrireducens]